MSTAHETRVPLHLESPRHQPVQHRILVDPIGFVVLACRSFSFRSVLVLSVAYAASVVS